ncbi:MAG: hypothetical protein KHX56_00200 [Clostridiales bacterium]|nr:hypothetical protein [Clostridiales bacterium]
MLEMDVIQVRGFRNIVQNGKITGFQFRVRSTYYRGIWLSLLRPGDIIVDNERFPRDSVLWEIGGLEYTPEEMLKTGDVQWPNSEAAVIKVKKPGGLESGYHDVSIGYRYIMSYIPPVVCSDEAFEHIPMDIFSKRMILV